MSERVDIWTVYLGADGVPVLVKGSAIVSAKRVKLDPYDARFGRGIEWATKGHGEVWGRGARSEAPDHWFCREAALQRWREYVESQIKRHELELRGWKGLRGIEPTEEPTP